MAANKNNDAVPKASKNSNDTIKKMSKTTKTVSKLFTFLETLSFSYNARNEKILCTFLFCYIISYRCRLCFFSLYFCCCCRRFNHSEAHSKFSTIIIVPVNNTGKKPCTPLSF